MNIKILSLSFLLVIASCMTGTTQSFQNSLNKQKEAIYRSELAKAQKDQAIADRAQAKICKDLSKPEIGKIWHQRIKEHTNCRELGLDCSASLNAYKEATKDYIELTEYKNKFIPAYRKAQFHHSKIVFLEWMLAKENPKNIEDVIKILENTYNSDPNDIINYAEVDHQTAQYFRSLADQLKQQNNNLNTNTSQ